MFYTVYKTTNLINGKFYIGTHKTSDPNDSYLGSGNLLCRAIEKYGRDNFRKDVMFIFDNPADMFAKEAELVTRDFLAENNTYNLKLGGCGGFDWINSNGLSRDKDHQSKAGKSSWRRCREKGVGLWSASTREKILVSREKLKIVSDAELLNAYSETGSVRGAMRQLGLSNGGPSRRLHRLLKSKPPQR